MVLNLCNYITSMKKILFTLIFTFIIFASVSAQYSGGSGTKSSPYRIADARDLSRIGQSPYTLPHLQDAYYVLVNNIDLSKYQNSWTPIAPDSRFKVHLDGAGYVITGLSITSTKDEVGLFKEIREGSVKNLTIKISEGQAVKGAWSIGALVGLSECSSYTNCQLHGTVSGNSNVGGLIGESSDDNVVDCSFTGTVQGVSNYVGGLVGGAFDLKMTDCYVQGAITSTNGSSVGGAVGAASASTFLRVITCVETSAEREVGGLVGYVRSSDISFSASTGKISGNNSVGGLAGSLYTSSVKDAYTTASLRVPSDRPGALLAGEATASTLTRVYATGTDLNGYLRPHLVYKPEEAKLDQAYFNYETAGPSWPAPNDIQYIQQDNCARTTRQLMQSSNYTNWNINSGSDWVMQDDQSYPYFSWQPNLTDNNAQLATLTIEGHNISLNSNSYTYAYTPKNGVNTITVEAKPQAQKARVSGTGPRALPQSPTYLTLVVSPPNGVMPKIYTIVASPQVFKGQGTAQDPYQIGTAEELNAMRRFSGPVFERSCFRLMNDIDLTTFLADSTAGWLPIGTAKGSEFCGTLHGGGHTISGLHINRPSMLYAGLFSALIGAARIDSLYVEVAPGKAVSAGSFVGILAGFSEADLTAVGVSGAVKGASVVGGLAGELNNASVRASFANVRVDAGEYAGGLAGRLYATNLNNSYAVGKVSGNQYIGGLLGRGKNSKIVESYAGVQVYGSWTTGAFAGSLEAASVTAVCYDKERAVITNALGQQSGGTVTIRPRSTAEMLQDSSFADWLVPDIWSQQTGLSYPYLTWQPNRDNNNAQLKTISVGAGEITVKPGILDYAHRVRIGTEKISIAVTPADSLATVLDAIGDTTLREGANTFHIRTFSSNGLFYLRYKLDVNRVKFDNAWLKDIKISRGALSPAFDSTILNYTVALPDSVKYFGLAGLAADDSAKVSGNTLRALLHTGDNPFVLTVTSEDSLVQKVYTVTAVRAVSDNADLRLITTDKGIFLPAFQPEILHYAVLVPDTCRTISIYGLAAQDSAYVTGNVQDYALSLPKTVFNLEVTAESGVQKTYAVTVYRVNASDTTKMNANLQQLTVNPGTLQPIFDPATTAYTVQLPYSTTQISITGVAADTTATVLGNVDNAPLHTGDNIFAVTVLSGAGRTKSYVLRVNRARSDVSGLENIIYSAGVLSPAFETGHTDYIVSVPDEVTTISLAGIPLNEKARVEGNVVQAPLQTGDNLFVIRVTSEDSSAITTYTINVVRAVANNACLSGINLSAGSLTPAFHPEVTDYLVTVNNNVQQISITAVPVSSGATVTGMVTDAPLTEGPNTFTLLVTATGGAQQTYRLLVFRADPAASDDNSLASLTVSSGTLDPVFDPAVTSYTVSVSYDISVISFTAVANHPDARIVGNFSDAVLHTGENRFAISVVAPDKSIRTYSVTVLRQPSTRLSTIMLSSGNLEPEFSPDIRAYTVTVPYATNIMRVTGVAEDPSATVSGNQLIALNTGSNTFTLVVNAADGTSGSYSIIVNRAKSSSVRLTSFTVSTAGDMLIHNSPVAYCNASGKINIVVKNGCSTITVSLYAGAGSTVTGNLFRQEIPEGSSDYPINVTSEDGSATATYLLRIFRAELSEDEAPTLSGLELSAGTLTPAFSPDVLSYSWKLDVNTSSVTINATTAESGALLLGNVQNYPVNPGTSTYKLVVAAPNGKASTYTLNIDRERPSEARLSSITVSCPDSLLTLNPAFDPDVPEYTVQTHALTTRISIAATTLDQYASFTGQRTNATLNKGENVFPLVVTASNGNSLTYTLRVTRPLSDDAALADIQTGGRPLSPAFHPGNWSYIMVVPDTVAHISLTGVAHHSAATVSGNVDRAPLVKGENIFRLRVTAENGIAQQLYQVKVIRLRTGNALLDTLLLSGPGILAPAFDPGVFNYTFNLSAALDTISLTGIPQDTAAMVAGNAVQAPLKTGANPFSLTVQSENGLNTNVYTVTVVRPQASEARLSAIALNVNDTLSPAFRPDIFRYQLAVPNHTAAISMTGIPIDAAATISGNVTDSVLTTGLNPFVLTVVSEDLSDTLEYRVDVTRARSNNADLAGITYSAGTLSPAFNAANLAYVLSVPDHVQRLSLSGLPFSSAARVTGNVQDSLLTARVTPFPINVASEDSTQHKQYVVTVVRQKSANTRLDTLTVSAGLLQPQFHPDSLHYRVALPHAMDTISIAARPQDLKTVVAGTVDKAPLHTGDQLFNIVAVAENGQSQTYTIKVGREPSAEARLTGITVSAGELTPLFHADSLDYMLSVHDTIGRISINGQPLDSKAQVQGNVQDYPLQQGDNHFSLRVTSENGANVLSYNIRVLRNTSDNVAMAAINLSQGTLFPAFSTGQYQYQVQVGNAVQTISITGVPAHDSATVQGNVTEASLLTGENEFLLTVHAENGDISRPYSVKVLRAKSANADLSVLTLSTGKLEPAFNPQVTAYTASVENACSSLSLTLQTADPAATILGNYTGILLNKGDNSITIYVRAEDGNIKTYTLNVHRAEKSSNNYLRTLIVNGEEVKNFSPTCHYYSVHLWNENNIVSVHGVAEDPNADVDGNIDNEELTKDSKTYKIKVKPEDGSDKRVYEVEVFRYETINSKLKDIEFDPDAGTLVSLELVIPDLLSIAKGTFGGLSSLIPAKRNIPGMAIDVLNVFNFDPNTLQYLYIVPHSQDKLKVKGIPEKEGSFVHPRFGTTQSLHVGLNNFRIAVMSEAGGMPHIYTVHVIRPGENTSDNANLKGITLSAGTLSPKFDKDQLEYTVELDHAVSKISITGEKDSKKALLLGNVKDMQVPTGTTQVPLIVLAEDGVTQKQYMVKVVRKESNNANLKQITVSQGLLSPAFDKDVTQYSVNVKDTVAEISIAGFPEHDYATVVGNESEADLEPGDNTFTLTGVSEDGSVQKVYTVVVHRARTGASTNNQLASLSVTPGMLSPAFDPAVESYTVEVDNAVTSISVLATAAEAKATVSGNVSNRPLTTNENILRVIVTAESGAQKIYTITVVRRKSNNADLADIRLSPSTLQLNFHKDVLYYEVAVPNSEDLAAVIGIPANEGAKVAGQAADSALVVGDNLFRLLVTSEDSSVNKTYTVNMIRAKSPETRLTGIHLSAGTLDPDFSDKVHAYEVQVSNAVDTISITAVPADPGAYVDGNVSGAPLLTTGVNTFILKTTSEDSLHTAYDTVNIIRAKSDNAGLKAILLSQGQLLTAVVPEMTEYWAVVADTATKVDVQALAVDAMATVSGDTTGYVLTPGVNLLNLVVTAENGNSRLYTLSIYKPDPKPEPELPGSRELKYLRVSEGKLNPAFVPSQNTYTVQVGHEVETINITGVAKDPASKVVGNSYNAPLHTGANLFEIYVITASGTVNTYSVSVHRAYASNNRLSALWVSEGCLHPAFHADSLQYTVYAPREQQYISIVGRTEDLKARVEGNVWQDSLTLGWNDYPVVVTAQDSSTRTYTVRVNRSYSANVLLKDIRLSTGDLQPVFNAYTREYLVSLPDTVQRISITGIPADTLYARVEGNVSDSLLQTGDNWFTLRVHAENGLISDYRVNVHRRTNSVSTDCSLKSLEMDYGSFDTPFDPLDLSYFAVVPNEISTISIRGVAAHTGARVIGNVDRATLRPGHNSFDIVVMAEAGNTKTYTVNIIRAQAVAAKLKDIHITSGSLSPAFHPDSVNYHVRVSHEQLRISIFGELADTTAKVLGNVNDVLLKTGDNVFSLLVVSESGAIVAYMITVSREAYLPSPDADLAEIVLSEGQLSPAFDPAHTAYTVQVAANVRTISIVGRPSDEKARLSGNVVGAALQEGEQLFSLFVEAEAGNSKTYTVKVIREELFPLQVDGFLLNEGMAMTPFSTVSLGYLINQGLPTHFMVGEDPALTDAVWYDYYKTPHIYTFKQEKAGLKTVYSKLKNEKGETAILCDSIYYRSAPERLPQKEDAGTMDAAVYPNPVQSVANIRIDDSLSGPVRVIVYTLTGTVYLNQEFRAPVFDLDLSAYPSGLLLIKISDKDRYVVKQVLKR